MHCFGVDIGGTSVKIGLFSKEDGLIEKWEIPTQKGNDPEACLMGIARSIKTCLERRGMAKKDIAGIGMTAPGPISKDGVLYHAVNIGWGEVWLSKEAERIIGIAPVYVGNDASVAALGEHTFGAGVETKNMLMVTLGTGVGGGVIVDGHIVSGKDGIAGEIGHTTVNPFEEEYCNCGNRGCTEQYASATGMVRIAKKFLAKSQLESSLREFEPLTVKDLWDCGRDGDELALEIIAEVSNMLGISLANASYIFDPEMIVIGGGVSLAGEFLRSTIEQAFLHYMRLGSKHKEVRLAKLRNDAGIYGAAAMVFDESL